MARDQLKCARCRSIPRWRAIVRVLEAFFPAWRQMAIHECSPGGTSSAKLARECRGCVQTHWYPDVPAGSVKDGYRSENLEQQTFPDASFDMVITQDVFQRPKTRLGLPIFTLATDRAPESCVVIVVMRSLRF